jgi:hypothetical protein
MEKWFVGCGAATGGVYGVFDHEVSIAAVYFFRGRLRFARSTQRHDVVSFL